MTKRILARALESGRSDDNEETLRKRFETHNKEQTLVLEHYKGLNKLVTVNFFIPQEMFIFFLFENFLDKWNEYYRQCIR